MAEMLGECCEKKSEAYTCPMTQFVNLISGKWAIPILYRLIVINTPVRFGDLLRAAAPITQKELTKQLRLFEQRGLVTRTVYPEIPPSGRLDSTPWPLPPKRTLSTYALDEGARVCARLREGPSGCP